MAESFYMIKKFNSYNKSTSVFRLIHETADKTKKHVDENHDCMKKRILCDYCKTDWKKFHGDWEKYDDADGAGITYTVFKVGVAP